MRTLSGEPHWTVKAYSDPGACTARQPCRKKPVFFLYGIF
jgi:hypothetical protein